MNATYPVDWKRLFKSLSVFISVAIIVPVSLLMMVRYASSGFDHAKTFEHLSFPAFLLMLLCVPPFSAAIALLVALWLRRAAINIKDEAIHGLNYWGFRNRIPLNDITRLTSFHNNGINAIVVNSRYHGQIFISDKTQCLPELLALLNGHLPEDAAAESSGRQ